MDGSVAALQDALRQTEKTELGAAKNLPPEFYTSPEFHRLEEDRIFRAEWICLGRADDIPKPGDYFTAQLLNEPLLVTRGDDNKVRVLSNVCRHRGTTLANGRGNGKRVICPYHGWAYNCDGQLANAPYMENVPGFDLKKTKLPEFASEIWKGFVYVNLDGKAAPLVPRLAGLGAFIDKYRMEDMATFGRGETVWNTNWKCSVENFIEGYHIPFIHPETIYPFRELSDKIPGGPGYTGYRARQKPGQPQKGVYPADATDVERFSSMIFVIYPTQLVALSAFVTSLSLRPLGPGRIEMHWDKASYDKNPSAEQISRSMTYFDTFMPEDKDVVERVHLGLKSSRMDECELGPESLMGTVADFHRYVAKLIVV